MRGKSLLRAAGNEISVLRAAELTGLSSFQKPRKPPRYATGPSFASEICSRSVRSFICGRWSKFFKVSPDFAVK